MEVHNPKMPGVPVPEIMRMLAPFQAAARSPERVSQYLNVGDDSNYQTRTMYELFVHVIKELNAVKGRLDKLEALLGTPQ